VSSVILLVALRDAVIQGDTAVFAQLIPGEHLLHGLWFADVDCATRLGDAGPLTEPRRADLRKCLADHGLRLESKAGMDGGAALAIDPGVVLDLGITGGKIEQISMPPRSPVLRTPRPSTGMPLHRTSSRAHSPSSLLVMFARPSLRCLGDAQGSS
jgi:hypothetical protein